MKKEVWKECPIAKPYEVSSLGRIRNPKTGRVLSQCNHSKGYLIVNICGGTKTVHKLVASTFIDKPQDKKEINHKNGNKKDNRIENLEWVTHSENNLHCYRILKRKLSCLGKFGKDHPRSKPVVRISVNNNEKIVYQSLTEAAKENNVSVSYISTHCLGKSNTCKNYKWKFC